MTKHFIELRLGVLQFARGATYLSLICIRLFQINSAISRDGTQFDEITEWIFFARSKLLLHLYFFNGIKYTSFSWRLT